MYHPSIVVVGLLGGGWGGEGVLHINLLTYPLKTTILVDRVPHFIYKKEVTLILKKTFIKGNLFAGRFPKSK